MLLNLVPKFDFVWIVSCSWSNHTTLLRMFVAEKVLLLLVISLTAYGGIYVKYEKLMRVQFVWLGRICYERDSFDLVTYLFTSKTNWSVALTLKKCWKTDAIVYWLLGGVLLISKIMMMSSNGNIFGVTGHFCWEFPGEFPTQRPVTRSFDVLVDLRLNKRLSKQSWGWWFETISFPLWRHRNGHLWTCVRD